MFCSSHRHSGMKIRMLKLEMTKNSIEITTYGGYE